ncbi:lysozyme [Shimia sagamensis]|uniref:Lysozyme n=1 Tax=Shimia sagamensis TaxID=1566352 RepID=A0ABY1PMN8_9RHOB|nr:lysozyme [Shimia sagamensis]SMP37302.1 Phage-related lysozyme (muramidase), GH24 family [Shimia sagamensis]
MKLVNGWGRELRLSYTAIAFYVLAALTVLPDLIYWLFGTDTNPALWSALQLMVIALGIIGRVVLQTHEGAWKRRATVAVVVFLTALLSSQAMAQTSERATMRVLVPLVIHWEGEHRCVDDPALHCAYVDIVGVPTLCYGETKGVRLGQRATDAECRAMLEQRLTGDFRAGLHRYFTYDTRAERLTPERDAAFVSLAYNVGIRGAGRSTATRRLNAGDIAGGCKALTWWNRAGGRIVRGLVNRRAHEYRLCMKGLT